jgi:hypothetical protein
MHSWVFGEIEKTSTASTFGIGILFSPEGLGQKVGLQRRQVEFQAGFPDQVLDGFFGIEIGLFQDPLHRFSYVFPFWLDGHAISSFLAAQTLRYAGFIGHIGLASSQRWLF